MRTVTEYAYLVLLLDFVFEVSEMKAEYFPPREDVILQNEAPTDFYILVSGSVVRILFNNYFVISKLI